APPGRADVPHLLAPVDLQVIKAAGVTFARSLLERVIEERTGGDPAQAARVRARVGEVVGGTLDGVRPGTPQAARAKDLLVSEGLWSRYLEVGIGPDPEVFTKAPVLSAVGTGADVGVLGASVWNNPEPEAVLVVTRAAGCAARRSATTSTSATSKDAAPCCCPGPRTTTPRAPSARSSVC